MTTAPRGGQGTGAAPAAPGGLSGTSGPFRVPDIPSVLTNGSYAITARVDHIETGPAQAGRHRVDIYLDVENTGTLPLLPVWYSRITDTRGTTYGGSGSRMAEPVPKAPCWSRGRP